MPADPAPPLWGLVATIKAPLPEIEAFAAHHLELGAHRLYLYLDAPDPDTHARLKAHPKIRVQSCDADWWKRLGKPRPDGHQYRQVLNATHAYGRKPEVTWLAHIDVDEFLWPDTPLTDQLAALPDSCGCARVRPAEALSGDGTAFKALMPAGPQRDAALARLYPRFGRDVKAGFLSHVQGKLFLRTGQGPMIFKIHNVFKGDTPNPGEAALEGTTLLHCHARSWADWIAAYRYRVRHGSYRASLGPTRPRAHGGLTMHELLRSIERDAGESGLRAFHDELCADTPLHRDRLQAEGLLRLHDLDLATKRAKHFPQNRVD